VNFPLPPIARSLRFGLCALSLCAAAAQAQLTFDPANPPASATPPTDQYFEYTGTYSHQKGPKTMMVFQVRPSDGAAWASPPTFATLDGQLSTTSQDYYSASYHQTWFGPKRDGVHDVPRLVVTPVLNLPKTAAQYQASFGTLQSDCLAAVRALGGNYAAGAVWDYNNFDRWAVMSNTKMISSTGLAYVGGRFAWTGGSISGGVAEHELGHNWGVVHANSWGVAAGEHPRASSGSSGEYGDGWDLMGGGGTSQMFNPQFRENLGFLERSRGEALDLTTSGTYRLYDYIHNDSRQATSLVRALVIPMSSFTDSKRVILGFGHSNGLDGGLGRTDWNRNAVTVHSKLSDGSDRIDTTPDSSPTNDDDDSSIKIGRTYSEGPNVNGNQTYGGFHVTPVARGNTTVNGQAHEWIDVVVNYQNQIAGNLPPGNVTVASAAPTVLVGSTVAYSTTTNAAITLNATASDPNGDPLAWDWNFGRTGNGSVSITSCSTQSPVYPNPGLYRVDVTASDMKGGNATGSAWVNVGSQPLFNATSVSTVGNLSYRYYEGTFTSVPNFQTQFPVEQGSVAGFSIAPRNRNDDFAFLFEGYINIPATDIYSFHVKSEDGAKLYIDGVLLVNNDGTKSVAIEATGSIQLAAGLHPVRLEYFHQTGSELLEVRWSTLSQPSAAIPAGSFAQIDPGVNPPPSVSILTPTSDEAFVVGASVQLTANASDADGIAKVQYFFNGAFLGESTDAANGYPVVWNDVSVGGKTVVAVAYDNSGKSANSAPVTFVVEAPEPRNSLGLNFGATNGTNTLSSSEAIGAVYTTLNWNNYNSDISAASGNVVRDQTGADAGVRATWAASGAGSGTFSNLADSSSGAGRLMRGGLFRRFDIEPSPNPNPYTTITNIPFDQYDVYVYFDYGRSASEDATVQRFVLTPSEGPQSILFGRNSGNNSDQLGDYPNYDTWIGFREAKATSLNATASELFGNYVVFRNQTASTFTVESTRNNGLTNGTTGRHGRYFNAVQIVQAPATIPRVVITESGGNTTVAEGGAADTYDLRLAVAPAGNVTVTITPGTQLTADPQSVVFTAADWNLPRTITVRAVDDALPEGPHAANLTHAVSGTGNYAGVTSGRDVAVSITDNDLSSVAVTAAGTAVEGPTPTNATFQLARSGLGNYSAPLTVSFTINGTAVAGTDYNLTGGAVTLNATSGEGTAIIPAGQAQVFLTVVPVNNGATEADRTVQLNVGASGNYLAGSPSSATLPLLDDDSIDYFTEYFESSAAFDLNGQSITFTPANGSFTASRAVVSAFPSGTSSFSTFTENSTAMGNGSIGGGSVDDGWWNHTLNASFPYLGSNYTVVRVGTNGHLSLNGSSFSDSGNSLSSHFTSGRPRISGLARDLDPGAGGSVQHRRITGDAFGNRTVFYWNGVNNYSGGGANSFQIELCDDGRIRMTWLNCAPSGDCVVGLSSGNTTTMPSSPYNGTASPRPFFETDLGGYPAASNSAPQFVSAPPLLGTAGQPYLYTAVATDSGGGPVIFTAPTKPAWLTLTDNGNATATLTGTPVTPGTYPVVLQISDGNLTANQSFDISVAPAGGNNAPVFTSSPILLVAAGANYSYSVAATDADGQTLAFSASAKPGWLTLTDLGNGTATLSGSVPAEALTAPVTLAVTDGWTTTSQSFTVTVNAPPVARIVRPAATAVGLPSTGANLVLEGVATDDGLPAGGNLTTAWSVVSGPGNVTFSAPAALQTAATFPANGTYVVRFTAADGNATASDDLTVLVNVDAAPILANALQGHWRFEEGSGNTTADASGNGRNATLSNGTWTTGISGGGLSSNASTNVYADAAYGEPSNVTVSAWVRPSVVPASGDRVFWTFRDGSNNRLRAYLGNGTRKIRVLADRSTDGIWEAPFALSAETWTHVVVVYSNAVAGNVPTVYINGVAQTLTTISTPSGSLSAGSATFRMASSWAGAIDEVRVFNRLVPASEIPLLMLSAPSNTAPSVSAGPDLAGILSAGVTLAGNATDDGLPAVPGAMSLAWSQVSGPGSATFGDPTVASNNVTFTTAGNYVLRLLADDGELQTFDDVNVAVQGPPPAPTGLIATTVSSSQIDLAWTDPATDEIAYVIERRAGADPFADVASLGVDAIAYSDTGLAANTTYTYRVRVTNNAGSTHSASASATTGISTSGNGTGFTDWIEGFPALPTDQRDPTDDWDRDGADNVLEYGLKLNPMQPDADLLPKASIVVIGGGRYLQLTYRQRTGGTGTTGVDYTVGGITYAVEVASELLPAAWESSGALVEAIGSPIDNGDETVTVTVRVRDPVSGDPAKFARLRISLE
jgi:hypothetical protein